MPGAWRWPSKVIIVTVATGLVPGPGQTGDGRLPMGGELETMYRQRQDRDFRRQQAAYVLAADGLRWGLLPLLVKNLI